MSYLSVNTMSVPAFEYARRRSYIVNGYNDSNNELVHRISSIDYQLDWKVQQLDIDDDETDRDRQLLAAARRIAANTPIRKDSTIMEEGLRFLLYMPDIVKKCLLDGTLPFRADPYDILSRERPVPCIYCIYLVRNDNVPFTVGDVQQIAAVVKEYATACRVYREDGDEDDLVHNLDVSVRKKQPEYGHYCSYATTTKSHL